MDGFSKHLEPFATPAIVALVGLCAFGLGRLSMGKTEVPQLIITTPTNWAAAAQAAAPSAQNIVASKNGTKYYLPSCPSASRINEENRVWFATVEEAQAAGYEPSANCPGL